MITYNDDTETHLLHHEGHPGPDSDYDSDPDSTGPDQTAIIDKIANRSQSQMANGPQGLLVGKQTHSEGYREAVGNLNRF